MTTKTDEQELADFEAWWEKEGQYCRAGGGDYEKTFAYRAYQEGRRAALQEQDREVIIEALKCAQNNECGPRRPFGSSDPDSDDYEHDAFMWDYYQRAIDHAHRIEGEVK